MTTFVEEAGGLLLPTKGLVTVELADADTGRVTHRETAENFLSQQSLRVARWWQRMMWGAYSPAETAATDGGLPTEMPWFPAQHLAYWNDATAEDAANEDVVRADLVGWASRHPVGSPTGKRGVVNISESVLTDAAMKWVFDWSTAQGNGTFQSVGWTRVREETGIPVARFPDGDRVAFLQAGTGAPATFTGGIWWDAANSLWNVSEAESGSVTAIKSAPAVGGALTLICNLAGTSWPQTSNQSLYGLARLGTDIIVCGSGTSLSPRLSRHTVAGAQSWTRTETNAVVPGIYTDCTVDGSGNIWTVANDGKMRRHNPADGTIAATVTPAVAVGPSGLQGIAYDPADGNFWVMGWLFLTNNIASKQIAKLDASGNQVVGAPAYSLYEGASSVASTAPWAGTYAIPGAQLRDSYMLDYFRATTGNGSDIARAGATVNYLLVGNTFLAPLTMKGTEVWIGGLSTVIPGGGGVTRTGVNSASAASRGTLGTRSRLASPVTKTSAQTLKVTYQFNFS